MNIFEVVLKRRYNASQLEEQLSTFDSATAIMESRRAEILVQLANLAAREALGELEKTEVKTLQDLRNEHLSLDRDLEIRTAARAVIARALGAAQADEARAERLEKIKAARAWAERMSTATDDLISAMDAVIEKLAAMKRVDAETPHIFVAERPSTAPMIGGWLAKFRYFVEPDAFVHAAGTLYAEKALVKQTLVDIESAVETTREHNARMMKADLARGRA